MSLPSKGIIDRPVEEPEFRLRLAETDRPDKAMHLATPMQATSLTSFGRARARLAETMDERL